ncbi:MAG: ABC transporter substrate-binding protein [Dehalococcoidia bacterium]|nr:ABC transporter substrate-binding protein [Dehalococcoidia bacterium]
MRVYWRFLSSMILVPALAFLLACGPGAEPTPTATVAPTATPTLAPAATPTSAAPATATPTRPGPTATPTPTAVAVATPTPTPGKQPKRGGTLRWGGTSLPPNFDAQLLSASSDFFMSGSKLYNNLLVNYVGEVTECEVCSEWHLENNGKAVVFTLIKGIKFQTGQELTSADVKYSLRMIMGDVDGIVSPRSGVVKEYIESIETPDKYTLRINLIRPSPFVPKILANISSVIYRDGTAREDFKKAPAGSGPFLVDKITPGASWSLVRNPNYFKPGQPYLDKVELTQIVEESTKFAAVMTGRSDLTMSGAPPPDQYVTLFKQMAAEGKITFYPYTHGVGFVGVWMVVTKSPFDNLKLRQAVNLALDRTRLGLASWGIAPHYPQLLRYTEDSPYSTRPGSEIWDVVPGWGTVAKKAQEVEQAKQLVKDAGYPNGLDTELIFKTGSYTARGVEEIQKQLAPIGIRINLNLVSGSAWQERVTALTYTMQYTFVGLGTADPDETVGGFWVTGAPSNWAGYSNPEVDKLFVQMSSEPDFAKRKQLLRQIEDIVVLKDIGYAPSPSPAGLAFWWKRLQGVTIGGGPLNFSSGLTRGDRLWIEE